jgi:hypothetical protein
LALRLQFMPRFGGGSALVVRRRMVITRQKYPSRTRLILGVIGLVVILFVSFVAWLFYLDTRDWMESSSPKKLGFHSSLVILARLDTNTPMSFVVTEIWKQPTEASAQPIKVGARFPGWSKDAGSLPDGEVIFCHRDQSPIPFIEPKPKFTPWSIYAIRQGRIDNMTVQQFKMACGL